MPNWRASSSRPKQAFRTTRRAMPLTSDRGFRRSRKTRTRSSAPLTMRQPRLITSSGRTVASNCRRQPLCVRRPSWWPAPNRRPARPPCNRREPEMSGEPRLRSGLSRSRSETGRLRLATPSALNEANAVAVQALGNGVRTFSAQTESGVYRGTVVGDTDEHVVQRVSQRSAVAHRKADLDTTPMAGQNVSIAYSNARGSVRELRERAKGPERAR